jgi:hypothetical protein
VAAAADVADVADVAGDADVAVAALHHGDFALSFVLSPLLQIRGIVVIVACVKMNGTRGQQKNVSLFLSFFTFFSPEKVCFLSGLGLLFHTPAFFPCVPSRVAR